MLQIICACGIPSSGKSFWANRFVSQSANWVRFSRDDSRAAINGGNPWVHFNKGNPQAVEDIVTKMRNAFIFESLKQGKNIILDETNNNSRTFREVCRLLETCEYEVSVTEKPFYIDLETALARDRARTPSVGDKVVQDFFRKFGGEKFKGYQGKQKVIMKRDSLPVLHNGPEAIICDLDGTLCLYGDKNPYDRDFENDEINKAVQNVLLKFSGLEGYGTQLLFVSGRHEKAREQTIQFLDKNRLAGYNLFMRADKDMRNDAIVKFEIYRDNIYGKYDVQLVLDDRNRVVKLWRELGLTCFQVADGDF
jgi:predicted kinase